jgi:hypothetical protein
MRGVYINFCFPHSIQFIISIFCDMKKVDCRQNRIKEGNTGREVVVLPLQKGNTEHY